MDNWITFKLDLTIDMLLDGRLVAVYYYDGRECQIDDIWSCPNLQLRKMSDDYYNRQYEPIAQETQLHFEIRFKPGCVIDTQKSYVQLGYAGKRNDWVGPGVLFQYSLSRYINQPYINITAKQ